MVKTRSRIISSAELPGAEKAAIAQLKFYRVRVEEKKITKVMLETSG
jgi:hypothetical protein